MYYTDQVKAPPTIEDREAEETMLCGPGPCNFHPSVREALNGPIIHAMNEEYFKVIADIRKGLQYAFQTESELVLGITGAGHAGMETVVSNLFAPGETVVVAARGIWDERVTTIMTRYGIKAIVEQRPFNSAFSLEELEQMLTRHKPVALYVTHGDSSTGTVQHMEGLGHICHKHGALLVTDTVVSLGGVPFLMDEWGVDAVFSAIQKALSGPAGIAMVAFSPRAEERIKNRKHEPPFYFDIQQLARQWNCYGDTRHYHHTMSPPLLHALRASLKELCKETLPVAWARHAATVKRFHERLQKMPVEFLVPKPEQRLATVTTLRLPTGYDYLQVAKYMRDVKKITIFAGLGPTAGKALRIGIMGINATPANADKVADALFDTLTVLRRSKL